MITSYNLDPSSLQASFVIKNIPIVSEANICNHWTKKRKRRITQDQLVRIAWLNEKVKVKLPCLIILTRIGPKEMDYDNLVISLKAIRDSISDLLIPGYTKGLVDNDSRLKWLYSQKKGRYRDLKIEIYKKKFLTPNLSTPTLDLK